VHVDPAVHHALVILAEARATSVNAVAKQILTDAVAVAGLLPASRRDEGSSVGTKPTRAPRKRKVRSVHSIEKGEEAPAATGMLDATGRAERAVEVD
jgi:hypothetical protein